MLLVHSVVSLTWQWHENSLHVNVYVDCDDGMDCGMFELVVHTVAGFTNVSMCFMNMFMGCKHGTIFISER